MLKNEVAKPDLLSECSNSQQAVANTENVFADSLVLKEAFKTLYTARRHLLTRLGNGDEDNCKDNVDCLLSIINNVMLLHKTFNLSVEQSNNLYRELIAGELIDECHK